MGGLTGIVLAGGKGKRLNNPDKGLLRIEGKTIIERLLKTIRPMFKEIIIVTARKEKYKYLNLRLVKDIIKDKGPLGGIHAGLVNSNTIYSFVFAFDMPSVNKNLIEYMIGKIQGYDCVLPKWQNNIEPLYAIYSKNCIGIIEKHLSQDRLKIAEIFPKLNTRYITQNEIKRFDKEGISFTNINLLEDLK